MERSNLNEEFSPLDWNSIQGHKKVKESLSRWVISDVFHDAIFISGSSGTGKNTLINTFIRALRCEGRSPDDPNPCNKCSKCKVKDIRELGIGDNIVWVQKGKNTETINEQIKIAINETYLPPFHGLVSNYKFIVVDELDSIDIGNLQNMLGPLEAHKALKTNKVVWILITMNEQRIANKDPELITALKGRCTYFPLSKPSQLDIMAKLGSVYRGITGEDAPIDSLRMIAAESNGSYRTALSELQKLMLCDIKLNPDLVADTYLYLAKSFRMEIWKALINNPKELYSLWMEISESCNTRKVIKQLDSDIDTSIANGYITNDQIVVQQAIYYHLHSLCNVTDWDLIKQMRGRDLINLGFLEGEKDGLERLAEYI